MCFNYDIRFSAAASAFIIVLSVLVLQSCGNTRRLASIRDGVVEVGLSIPSDHDFDKAQKELIGDIRVDSVDTGDGGPLIMNAIRDEMTGEMVATDIISASTVVARFRNVAERLGKVLIEFDITVPEAMIESGWKLKFSPLMQIMNDSISLAPVYITGAKYREEQMRGYRRYEAFLSSIVSDSSYFVRKEQLELFIRRYFPETYAMKTDSSFVPEPMAENVFGVSQRKALEHYTKHYRWQRNEMKKGNRQKMFDKYVKDPLEAGNLKLDTVITSSGGITYRYVQNVQSRPGLKKIGIALSGSLYEDGRKLCDLAMPEDLVFYVSSLSSLADMTPRYISRIVERRVYDNTRAFIDFASGSSVIDTLLRGNREELGRIRKCVSDITAKDEFGLDSIVVTASCSPEGSYRYNSRLSASRAESVVEYLKRYMDEEDVSCLRAGTVGENWEQLAKLAANDSLVSEHCRGEIYRIVGMSAVLAASKSQSGQRVTPEDMDTAECGLSSLKEYLYLREKIYPRLRSVKFDFYLHRKGMLKDTIRTTEIDSVYLKGVELLKNMDYKSAVEVLRPYHDYNTALAYLSAGYNRSALQDLESLPESAGRDYLLAIVLARLGRNAEALDAFNRSVGFEPSILHRANLDPELSGLIHNCSN